MNVDDKQVVRSVLETLYQAELEADGYAKVLVRNGRNMLEEQLR